MFYHSSFIHSAFCSACSLHLSLSLSLLSLRTRNGIYPMTAFGLPSPQQPQQETVKSPIVVPLVKSPTPEPAELETRRVRASLVECPGAEHWHVAHIRPQCWFIFKCWSDAVVIYFILTNCWLFLGLSGCCWLLPCRSRLFPRIKRRMYATEKYVHSIIRNCSFVLTLIIVIQVIQMQCSVEPLEEGAKYHVSCFF